MNASKKHLPMSESASAFIATASAATMAIRRTDSTRLTRIILAVTLLVVTLLVAFRYDYLSDAGPAAPESPFAYHATHSSTYAGLHPAYLSGFHVFATRNGKVEFIGDMEGSIGVLAGDSRRLGGSIDLRTGAFDFHLYLRTLSTGIPDRDTGLHNSLNIDKHPFAEFTGIFHPAFDPSSGATQHVIAEGTFTLNGIAQHVEIPATLLAGENSVQLEAKWILDVTRFGIEPPVFMSVTVSSEQEIRLEATLEPQLFASPGSSRNTHAKNDA
jgi:hypothetical protein